MEKVYLLNSRGLHGWGRPCLKRARSSQECSDFLTAFRHSYKNESEIQLIDEITSIIRKYDYLNCKQNYDEALEEISNIVYLDMPSGNIIKHYERITGYVIS